MSYLTSVALKHRSILVVVITVFSLLTAGCIGTTGDDDKDKNSAARTESSITRYLSGTVATGAPAAGTVTVVDTEGNTKSTQSDANGIYSLNIADMSAPYLIRVVPDNSTLPVMYSFATDSGVANITPFTHLALFLAYRKNLQSAFEGWSTESATWKRADVEQAVALINANFVNDLLNAGVDPKVYDFFTAPFAADHSGMDAFMDNHKVSFDGNGTSYQITDSSSQAVVFDESVDTTGYFIGARFIPDNAALWSYTITTVSDGEETTRTQNDWPGYFIPWNLERFNEYYWSALAAIPKEVTTCKDNPQATCNITFEVTQLDSSYEVIGNGEVGTRITATGSYSWKVSGWYKYSILPRQDIDETHSWSYTWVWERTK